MPLYRVLACRPESLDSTLSELVSSLGAKSGTYRAVVADEIESVLKLDDRFTHDVAAQPFVKAAVKSGLPLYLFTFEQDDAN